MYVKFFVNYVHINFVIKNLVLGKIKIKVFYFTARLLRINETTKRRMRRKKKGKKKKKKNKEKKIHYILTYLAHLGLPLELVLVLEQVLVLAQRLVVLALVQQLAQVLRNKKNVS